ncbi:MAG: flavin reductase family protein [Dehalococcoidia bacterium]|nr:flavin reductase family protein [Dehalococcoidia bacterium]
MSPSEEEFRRVMGRFATGVTIVTTALDGEKHGMTANSVTSVSLEPMLVLVCVDKAADTHDILRRAGIFAVNILSADQAHLSEKFAKKEFENAHGLDEIPHHAAATGAPVIDGCLAYLDCRTLAEHHGGDHTIFIGEVLDAGQSAGEPLLLYNGRYGGFEPA